MRPVGAFGTVLLGLWLAGFAGDETRETPLLGHFLYRAQVVADETTTVRRLDVDITGDGVAELFLATSQRLPQWFIYQKTGDKTYRFLGSLSFMANYFRVDQNPLRVTISLPDSAGVWKTAILRYRQGDPPLEECVPRGSMECRDTGEDFAKWRKRLGFRQAYARLTDVESTDNPEWVERETLDPLPSLGGLRRLLVSDGR
jgi:hypothetical protein